jgi:lipoate-protein ligase A
MSADVMAKWQAAKWSIIAEAVASPAMHVALDEALLNSVIQGERGPTLRFWAWAGPAVIIGRFQSLKNEVDITAANEMGITVVRRLSGGGAMYVRPGASITYSLYVPDAMLQGMTIRDSYAYCDGWVVESLRQHGADVRYEPLNDIASAQGKVGGAAQARRPGAVLHHTTIAWNMDAGELMRVLRIGREKISDKGIASAAKRVHPLSEQVTLNREQVVTSLDADFRRRFSCRDDAVTPTEHEAARALVETRYGTNDWTRELE